MPVLGVGVGLEAVAADVEPDGGVEGDLLVEEEVAELGVEDFGVFGGGEEAVAMPQSRMDSATRETRARTPSSRAVSPAPGVPLKPWRYLLATMLVAVTDQSAGTSTFFCSKMSLPFQSWMTASRRSQVISS